MTCKAGAAGLDHFLFAGGPDVVTCKAGIGTCQADRQALVILAKSLANPGQALVILEEYRESRTSTGNPRGIPEIRDEH